MAGKTTKVYISSDGTSAGTPTAIENQGDLDINWGKPIAKTAHKDGSVSVLGEEGISGSFTVMPSKPVGTGQALLLAAYDNEGTCYLQIADSITGGLEHEGDFVITLNSSKHPVSGTDEWAVEFSQNGDVTRATVA